MQTRQQNVPFPAMPPPVLANVNQESTDMAALISFLGGCSKQSATITDVVYCVNNWDIGGVINLQHHGLVLTIRGQGYLTLDFGRHGLTWMLCDAFPGFPEGTCLVKGFEVQVDAAVVKDYCANTKPFQWVGNNCKSWSKGMMEHMEIVEASGRDMLEDDESSILVEHEDHHLVRFAMCA